jgi:lipid-A-disaccharide synthase
MMATGGKRRVLIIAGEASGDLHGANLIRAARDIDPGLSFFGMGGRQMEAAGCDIRIDMKDLAVMGLLEVVFRLPVIRRAFRRVSSYFAGAERPDLLVLIDYPGFNLRLAGAAKQAGIPVLYYICPKIWASRPGRIKQIVRNVDRLAAIFPFEVELFGGQPIQVKYVGNPLLDEYHAPEPRGSVLRKHGLDETKPVVGLFPGSRKSEIRYILPTILKTAKLLKQQSPELQFMLPVASNLSESDLAASLQQEGVPAVLVQDDIYNVSAACDAVLSVSGTVTLQVALAGTPLAILYKTSTMTYAIGSRLVRIPLVGLPNIVAGREIVREFIQDNATPEQLTREMMKLLFDQPYRANVAADLSEMKNLLGTRGCAKRVANMIHEMVNLVDA